MWLTKAHTSQEAPTSISGSSSPHLEYSWIKSRIGIENGENGNVVISKEDIFLDAKELNS